MTLAADIDVALLAFKALALLGCVASGCYLLAQAARVSRPSTAVKGRVIARGRRRAAPVAVVPPPPRLAAGVELSRLAHVVASGRSHLDAAIACQMSAARHLDSAEVALNRLLSDIAKVMPPTIALTVEPRRELALAA